MKVLKSKATSILAVSALVFLGAVKSAKAVFFFAPVIWYIGVAVLGLGGIYLGARAPMTPMESFIWHLEPDQVDSFVYWEQRGYFHNGNYSPYQTTADRLQEFRARLKQTLVVDQKKMTEEEFGRVYGTEDHPNFCALSKEAIVASFVVHYGGAAQDYDLSKWSHCTP